MSFSSKFALFPHSESPMNGQKSRELSSQSSTSELQHRKLPICKASRSGDFDGIIVVGGRTRSRRERGSSTPSLAVVADCRLCKSTRRLSVPSFCSRQRPPTIYIFWRTSCRWRWISSSASVGDAPGSFGKDCNAKPSRVSLSFRCISVSDIEVISTLPTVLQCAPEASTSQAAI